MSIRKLFPVIGQARSSSNGFDSLSLCESNDRLGESSNHIREISRRQPAGLLESSRGLSAAIPPVQKAIVFDPARVTELVCASRSYA